MKFSNAFLRLVLTLGLILAPVIGSIHACGTYCRVFFHLYNWDRRVTSLNLTQECPGMTFHSVPWGNWGADTGQFGSKIDGHQFDGWHMSSGSSWYEWNSCTSRQDLYTVGDSAYYNWPTSGSDPYSQQKTVTGINRFSTTTGMRQWSVSCPRSGPTGWRGGCNSVDGSLILQGVIMALYELDPLDADEWVSTLTYVGTNQLEARLDCDTYQCDNSPPIVYHFSQNYGVSAWATILIDNSGLFGGDCQDQQPPREY